MFIRAQAELVPARCRCRSCSCDRRLVASGTIAPPTAAQAYNPGYSSMPSQAYPGYSSPASAGSDAGVSWILFTRHRIRGEGAPVTPAGFGTRVRVGGARAGVGGTQAGHRPAGVGRAGVGGGPSGINVGWGWGGWWGGRGCWNCGFRGGFHGGFAHAGFHGGGGGGGFHGGGGGGHR